MGRFLTRVVARLVLRARSALLVSCGMYENLTHCELTTALEGAIVQVELLTYPCCKAPGEEITTIPPRASPAQRLNALEEARQLLFAIREEIGRRLLPA
jgi:hypothetical protein